MLLALPNTYLEPWLLACFVFRVRRERRTRRGEERGKNTLYVDLFFFLFLLSGFPVPSSDWWTF